jgi:hypothetical protein
MVGGETGLAMRQPATVDVAVKEIVSSEESPYLVTDVVRDTIFTFFAGLPVYVLSDPTGRSFVMQAYSIEINPLTLDTLVGLESVLALPEGWTFKEIILTANLEVPSNGMATVVRDELKNAYQLSVNPII